MERAARRAPCGWKTDFPCDKERQVHPRRRDKIHTHDHQRGRTNPCLRMGVEVSDLLSWKLFFSILRIFSTFSMLARRTSLLSGSNNSPLNSKGSFSASQLDIHIFLFFSPSNRSLFFF